MLKLYKNIGGRLHYWETWDDDDNTSVIHWGKVGERGTTRQSSNENVDNEIGQRIQEDYQEITEDQLVALHIEYAVTDETLRQDLEKRDAIEEMMDEALGWTGLGHCDGGDVGSGTMEITCMVVDFDMAKQVIENELKNSPYKDFKRIYKEGE